MDDLKGMGNFKFLLEVYQAGTQACPRDLALDEAEGTPLFGEDKIHLFLLFISGTEGQPLTWDKSGK